MSRRRDRQRVADGQRVETDADLFDDESHDLLSRADIERVRSRAERGPEIGQGVAEAQIARLVGGRERQRLQRRGEDLLLVPERRHPCAQVVERDQLLLVGGDQPLHAIAQPSLLAGEVLDVLAAGIGLPGRVEPTIEFDLDEGRVVEQANDLVPHERIQLVLRTTRARTSRRTGSFTLSSAGGAPAPPTGQRWSGTST